MQNTLSRKNRAHFDFLLFFLTYGIAIFGVFCISIAMYNTDNEGISLLGNILSSRSGQMQCVWLILSVPVFFVVQAVPIEILRTRYYIAYLAVLGLLIVTMVASTAVNGIKSWLQTGFGRAIQPCEFAKLTVLLMLAKKLSARGNPIRTFREFAILMGMLGVPCAVVLLQGETGSVIVIGAMFCIMLIMSGADWRLCVALLGTVAIALAFVFGYALLSGSTDYRILRLLAFTDPQAYSSSGGYQLLQSQKAVGAGMITGVGVYQANSMTTLGFVPESSTDFIFSVVGESFGFVGSIALVAAYAIMLIHMMFLAKNTPDKYGQMIIYGVMGMLFFHVFENIAMVIGLMPITGIPLPFVSYGGSSFLTNIIGVALVVGVVRQRSNTAESSLILPDMNNSLLRNRRSRIRKLIDRVF